MNDQLKYHPTDDDDRDAPRESDEPPETWQAPRGAAYKVVAWAIILSFFGGVGVMIFAIVMNWVRG